MDAGIIKDVTAIDAHMNNPRRWHKWDTNIYKLPAGQQLPKDLRMGYLARGCSLPRIQQGLSSGTMALLV